MLVMWKLLSERRVSTLKLAAFSMSSRRYSRAFSKMASSFFSQAAARVRAMMPNTRFMASKAASMSAESSSGSTYTVDCTQ